MAAVATYVTESTFAGTHREIEKERGEREEEKERGEKERGGGRVRNTLKVKCRR